MAKPWDELHTKIDSEEAYNEATAFKGMTVIEVYAGAGGGIRLMFPSAHVAFLNADKCCSQQGGAGQVWPWFRH